MKASLFVTMLSLCAAGVGPCAAEDARAVDRVAIDIPPQNLGEALVSLAAARGFQVFYLSVLVESIPTPGVRGDLTVDEALRELLRGTGLTHRFLDDETVTILPLSNRDARRPADAGHAPVVSRTELPGTAPRIADPSAAGPTSFSAVTIDEVIVTARKRAETRFEVPATISIFDRATLDESGADSIADIQHSIPNFFYASQRPFATTLTMRGLGAALAVPGVGMYIDGAYQLSAAAFTLPLHDVERVEILKGPQGTLYGRNSFAGVINYVTRAPSDDFSADLSAEVGNGGTYKGAASISAPLLGDVLSGRVSVGMQRRDGFRHYQDGSEAENDDYDAINGVLAARPFDNFSARLRYAYVEKHGGSFQYHTAPDINSDRGRLLLTSPFQLGPWAGKHNGENSVRLESYNFNMTYSFPGADLVSVSTHDDGNDYVFYDSDIGPADSTNALSLRQRRAWSQELRLQSTGRSALAWLVAGYYGAGVSDGSNTIGGVLFPEGPYQPAGRQTFISRAVFTDLEYSLGERWKIGAGVRYDLIQKQATMPAGARLSDEFSDTQPKFTLTYSFTDDARVYATAAKGFREGGFVPHLAGTEFESYPNDTLWAYELGLKHRFADRRGNVDLALFYIDAQSLNGTALVSTPPVARRLITVPIGQAESYGVELSGSYALTDSFTIDLLGGYNEAAPTRLMAGVQPGTAIVAEQMINAPLWNVRLGAAVELPLAGNRTLKLRAAMSAMGPTNFLGEDSPGAPLTERDSYYLVDARASYEWSKYNVSVFVENATNTIYATDYRPVSTSQPFGGGTLPGVMYNSPRHYGLSFRVRL